MRRQISRRWRWAANTGRRGARSGWPTSRGGTWCCIFTRRTTTPGCTKQACGLRDVWGEFAGKAAVFGVSVDDAGSHQKFIDKFQLPFPLLSDTEQKIVQDYGVWVEKNMYGKKYMGTERSTFVIGGDGRLKAILRKVNPEQHAALVLAELD